MQLRANFVIKNDLVKNSAHAWWVSMEGNPSFRVTPSQKASYYFRKYVFIMFLVRSASCRCKTTISQLQPGITAAWLAQLVERQSLVCRTGGDC